MLSNTSLTSIRTAVLEQSRNDFSYFSQGVLGVKLPPQVVQGVETSLREKVDVTLCVKPYALRAIVQWLKLHCVSVFCEDVNADAVSEVAKWLDYTSESSPTHSVEVHSTADTITLRWRQVQ